MSVDVGVSKAKSDPNVVPLCDILLVLLIIFMVITPVAQKGIDIRLPETQESQGVISGSGSIILTLEEDLTIKLNQETVAKDLLLNRLKDEFQNRTNKTIFIRADKSVPYSEVLKMIDAAKGAGIEVLGVYTQQYETNPK
ncbi:MAG: biopolymer transporter ExbD [Acidobacteria bacterium]|jgi:biopolymer transport protein ExbD|nr:biopolymer transporter ExbD [Acidobacteriota bacterium]